jgi:type VI secretion system FHA domain protein
MPLKLRVISDHYKSLGPRRSQLFGVTGGTVGRASNNDWVLPDIKHFVSSHHAKVIFRAGSWLLEDTSRNGVYLNNSEKPLSETGPAKLEDGDRLRIGEYDVLVSVDEHSDFSPDASGQMPLPSALRDAASPQSKRSRNASRKHGTFRSEPAPSEVKLDTYIQPDLDVTDLLVPARRSVEKKDTLAHSASIQLNVDGFAGVSDGMSNGVADFCQGLGIDPGSLPSRTQSELLTAAGQLLRETAVQLTRTLKLQAARAAELELDSATTNDELASPLQTSRNVEATLHRLLDAQSDRKLNGVDALRDAFERIRAHHDAFDAAVAPAVDELLLRVNPEKVATRFERSNPPASLFASGKKAKYWDLLSEMYTAIDQRDSRGWPTVFAREFAKSMSAQLREQKNATSKSAQERAIPGLRS